MPKILVELFADNWDKDSTNCLWDWLEDELHAGNMATGSNLHVEDIKVVKEDE